MHFRYCYVYLLHARIIKKKAVNEAAENISTNAKYYESTLVPPYILERFGPFGPQDKSYPPPLGAVFVAPDGVESNNGKSIDSPTTLAEAIQNAETGSVIVLRGGTYRTGDLAFNKKITIQAYLNERPVIKGSNYPLSGTKGTLYEGGIRVPWIIYWPGHLEGGCSNDAVISTLDLFPTFIKAAGGDINKYEQLDGIDLQTYLTLPVDQRPKRTLYWREATVFGIRHGDIKLLDHPDQPAELFNLKEDFAEINNLHYEERDKVRNLYKLLYEWRITNKRPLWMFKPEFDHEQVQRGHKYHRKGNPKY